MKNLFNILFSLIIGMQTGYSQDQAGLKGYIPQFNGTLKGVPFLPRNLSVTEIADYAFHTKKPVLINPSNKSWSGEKGQNWPGYAEAQKQQILLGLKTVYGLIDLSDDEAERIFKKPTRIEKAPSRVKSTGLLTEGSGKVLPGQTGWVVRDSYITRDKLETEYMAVYEGPYGVYKISLVCGNSLELEVFKPKVTLPPAPEVEKIPVFCPEPTTAKFPVFCPDPTTGSQRIETSVLVGSNQGSGRIETTVSTTTNSNSNRIETTVAPQRSTGGMVPAR